MVGFFWFIHERCSLYQYQAPCRHEIRHFVIQKLNHPATVCAAALFCWKAWKSSYPHECVKVIVLGFFVVAMIKLHLFVISEPDEVHHWRRAAIQQLSALVATSCTHSTLWRQHYITTSKEYLTNSHILSKCFELIFVQLHLVKISCRLITIQLSYKRNTKGGIFYETLCIH